MKKNMNQLIKIMLGSFILMFAFSCTQPRTEAKLPRIAILGLAIESSTFSPALTHEEDFHASQGDSIFKEYPFLQPDSTLRKQATWIPLLYGHALPGGIVTKEAYASLVAKSIQLLKQNGPWCDECTRNGRP
jgi:hypothetical protein